MKLEDHIAAWNYAAVKVLDIRHAVMEPGDKLQGYILPACGFIYCVRGAASLNLNGIDYDADRHFIVHGGKGMRLSIEAGKIFEYYLLFYRASLPGRKDLARLLERSNPFRMQYGFESLEPLPLHYQLMAMEQLWAQGSLLERIQVKGLFYQFIHELLKQFTKDGINLRQPDVIGQVVRYIEEHYRHNLSLESIAEQFNYSPRHLSTRFKGETGFSLIEYLIRFRLKHAEELLRCTDAPLREIAEEVGYSDVYYFSRMFSKYNGQSPIRFRKESRLVSSSDNRPFTTAKFSIGEHISSRYNVIEYDNHYHYYYHNEITGGSSTMRLTKTSSFIVAMLLSFTLLLSACGSASVGSNATNSNGSKASEVTSSPANNSTATDNANKEAQTRTISTIKGDIVVPANPKRVVVLYLQGDLVALGIKPVGTSSVFEGAAFAEELGGIEDLGSWYEPNPEAIMAVKPDLIIAASEETYEILKDIAPTIPIPYEKMATDERIMKIGEVFGKEQEAQALLDNFHEKLERSKQKLDELGILDKTVTIIEGGKKEMAVIDSKLYGRGSQIIYEYLGLKAPEILQKKIDGREKATGGFVSLEVLPEYIGDFVFRSVWDGADDLSDNPIWNSIPAIKEGRLIEIGFDFSYYSDIYSLDKQLDFVVEKLVSAYEKNRKLDDRTTVIPNLRGKSYFGLFLLLGILLLLLSVAASISFGSASMSLKMAWTALFNFDPELTEHQIIHALRIPRTAADIIAGMCLAVAGAVMQGYTRNPLADSGLMGVNAGAALAMAVTLVFLPGQLQTTTLLVSFIGAGLGSGLTYLAASMNRSGMTPQRLVLAGISITMLFGAVGSFISLNYGIGRALAYWTSGSVAGATWMEIKLVIPWFLGGLALSLFIARSITVLNLGEEIAKGFGQRIVLVKMIATLAVLLLAGVAVALVGPIGFVGLIIPHIMRFFVGVDYRYIIPASAIYGGALMVVADIAGRLINRPAETALGIIFAMIGVPFFLLIASKERRAFK